jgi:hypothetical protein
MAVAEEIFGAMVRYREDSTDLPLSEIGIEETAQMTLKSDIYVFIVPL